jgi:hypothetical protein
LRRDFFVLIFKSRDRCRGRSAGQNVACLYNRPLLSVVGHVASVLFVGALDIASLGQNFLDQSAELLTANNFLTENIVVELKELLYVEFSRLRVVDVRVDKRL